MNNDNSASIVSKVRNYPPTLKLRRASDKMTAATTMVKKAVAVAASEEPKIMGNLED